MRNIRKNINTKSVIINKISVCVFVIFMLSTCVCERAHHKRSRHNNNKLQLKQLHGAEKFSKLHDLPLNGENGLWPNIFNVANYAKITSNATCGQNGREEFCRLAVELNRNRKSGSKCGVCDAPGSPDPAKQHPIENAILSDPSKWWQSPTLEQGSEYEFVTITLDLRQIFQVLYVIVKAANSPRPGTWVLERSMDGENFLPWQFYAISDEDCWDYFGIEPTPGKPRYNSPTDVICTSYYSKLLPLENGEIHTSLVTGRPDTNLTSHMEFTLARYVRLRFLRLRAAVIESAAPKWFTSGTYSEGPRARLLTGSGISDTQRGKGLYYSIRDINIGGQCVCNGHAQACLLNNLTKLFECQCEHNTCGMHCEYCCPMYNQVPYQTGFKSDTDPTFQCEKCECNGHASECLYDPKIAVDKESLDITGRYRGGGLCVNCTKFTTGVNCQQCIEGYYRPSDREPNHQVPCVPCDCHPAGSNGDCLREAFMEEDNVGDCICKSGYTGPRCSMCAPGYRGFPNCELCPCDPKGMNPDSDCEGDCDCKANVEGPTCSQCKSGFFALEASNDEGCISCWCSGVSNSCEEYIFDGSTYETMDGWLITDLTRTKFVKPIQDVDSNNLIISNDDFELEDYFWMAPMAYLGNKLETYGSYFELGLNWDVMRGDRSGKPILGPDLILFGSKTITSRATTHQGEGLQFRLQLIESEFYTESGEKVSRSEFLHVLSNLESILIRAKFHTDQSESLLERVLVTPGVHVEKCACPTGHTGLSCEKCDYGYVNMSTECIKCDCYGHSRTCDLEEGTCGECDHNTIGEKCDRCAAGYYGTYPLHGQPDDCKKCACPLEEESNNFSPSCQLDALELVDGGEPKENYVCTQCPQGYTGDHCERCDDGYFGNPVQLGSSCQKCECNGGPCDHLSGQCLSCRGNTEGFKCEKCKPGHFGDPKQANCKPCQCDVIGAVSEQCDLVSGECECKERFTGQSCSECQPGFGNTTAGCVPCECDSIGAALTDCHPVTGICQCRPGVEGFHCDACQHLYYGFSDQGCQSCGCNLLGSELATCDIVTGKCRCKPFVTGRTCNTCEVGYWGISSNIGCTKCDCDPIGSWNTTCNQNTGECHCKPGVGGQKCNECLPNYYEFTENGCKECEYCDLPGHVCDPDTGRCVCPPFSHGELCNKCTPNAYGFQPNQGCKACHCDAVGSWRSQCDPFLGKCTCRDGYTGDKCDKCALGYFGYPRCRRCNCNIHGTLESSCDSQSKQCSCDESDGHCQCKSNVIGKKCDVCRDGTFGLEKTNVEGCTPCFCFGRSTKCTQAGLTWGQIRTKDGRSLKIEKELSSRRFVNNIAYIEHITKPVYTYHHEIAHQIRIIESQFLNDRNGLLIIPETMGNITIGAYEPFESPLYWKLPSQFNGDHVVSYGGYLQFKAKQQQPRKQSKYPLVVITGNGITLAHYPTHGEGEEVRFHESLWTIYYGIDRSGGRVSRNLLMVVLQNVQEILIKATDQGFYTKAVLIEVVMDTAILVSGDPPPLARGVELCDCPTKYNASSCQNPSIGFYRYYNNRTSNTIDGTIIIEISPSDVTQLIGDVVPCNCNNRSSTCNIETGYCTNCRDNTAGQFCEICEKGYYGNPATSGCFPCPCPTASHNFAAGCQVKETGSFHCICKEGYRGRKCEDCDIGFYRNRLTGECQSCQCHQYGRASDECDQITGQCQCRAGFNGTDCSKCEAFRHVLDRHQCVPADDCTLQLLSRIDELNFQIDTNYAEISDGEVPAPYPLLDQINKTSHENLKQVEHFLNFKSEILDIPLEPIDRLVEQVREMERQIQNLEIKGSYELREWAYKIWDDIKGLNDSISETIEVLNYFTDNDKHVNIKKAVRLGKMELERVRSVDFGNRLREVQDILKECTLFLDLLSKITSKLSECQSRYSELKALIDATIGKISELDRVNLENRLNLDNVLKKASEIDDELNELESIESMYQHNIDDLKQLIHTDIKQSYFKLNDKLSQLNDLSDFLIDNQLNNTIFNLLKQKLKDGRNHASFLQKLADSYEDKFKATKDKAFKSVEASQVYQNIKEGIENITAIIGNITDANMMTKIIIQPEFGRSKLEEAETSLQEANQIKHAAELQKKHADRLQERQIHLNRTLDGIKDMLWTTGLADNNISKTLAEFNSSITNKMEQILFEANVKSDRMKELYSLAKQVQEDKTYKLLPQTNDFNTSQANLSVTVSSFEEKLTEAQTSKDHLEARIESLRIMNQNQRDIINRFNNSLIDKIQALRDKVEQARRLASEVQIPLSSRNEFKCTRVYRPYSIWKMGNSTSTTVSFIFSLTANVDNSPIVFAGGVHQFIAVEMVNRKIRLLWKLGEDTGIVIHPEPIEQLTSNSGYYYSVQVDRLRNIGTLSVRKKFMSNGTTVSTQDALKPVTKATSPKSTILNLGEVTDVWVGGTPTRANSLLLKQQGLSISIYDLIFNENPIGLWNYHETAQSKSCQSDTYWTYTLNEYHFNGAGYSVRELKNQFASSRMSITLTFKTFDEDALLVAVVSPKNNSFLSISLENGHLVYFVQYVGESQLRIVTPEKYNLGQSVRIEGSREYNKRKKQENAILKVNGKMYRNHTDIPITSKSQLPDLVKAKYYFGGLEPSLKLAQNVKYMVSTFQQYGSILGCLSEIQIDQVRIDPVDTEHDGVEYECSERTLNRVGFLGNGYIKLSITPIKIQSFSFLFNTARHNALLAVLFLKSKESYILIRLKSGTIECEINTKKRIILKTNREYNDNIFHDISLIRTDDKIELFVDDEFKDQADTGILHSGNVLYFGGINEMNFGDPAFEGTIRDVILNNELMLFNSPVDFEHVLIGRSLTTPSTPPALLESIDPHNVPLSMSSLDSGACNHRNYSYEQGALKLGDGPYSHVQHPLKIVDFWLKSFRLEFEFRTFYPNGMLFVSPGLQKDKRHHILLQIKNSSVHLTMSRGKVNRELVVPMKVNDGKWHKVEIRSEELKVTKKYRDTKWTLIVDHVQSPSKKCPRKLKVANVIYIGAWPEYGNRLPINLMRDLETFKGCVRNLKVNNELRDLTSNKTNDVLHNTGECFPNIESGSYFNGNAYALYQKQFELPPSFEFRLDFKTTELTGILLSYAPVFSVELHSGRVVLSATGEDSQKVSVEVALESPYDICDNEWHHIHGFYSETEPIIIKIDDKMSVPTFLNLGGVSNIGFRSGSLFIGGLPEMAGSGTLQTRDNFHGCIKNVEIGMEKRDWTDMDSIHNILLSSCPI